ncbi:unannotated protein [freshwater metagenome]|uniref:Unannotated protein n=1 Tax=freshwater metagenome TaxID=449393 RepID=A0A6J6QLF4_9ZZZZ
MTNHVDLSAGTSGALGRYRTATAVPKVNKTAIETKSPSQRRSYLRSAAR